MTHKEAIVTVHPNELTVHTDVSWWGLQNLEPPVTPPTVDTVSKKEKVMMKGVGDWGR